MSSKSAVAGVFALSAMGVLGVAGDASAHAHLLKAEPAVDGVVRTSVKVVRASFSEPLIAAFSSLDLARAKGGAVPVGKVVLAPGDPKTMSVSPKAPLPAGDYVVHWRAVSADTHRVTGRYSFHVAP